MISLQTLSAYSVGVRGTSLCIGIVAIALLASLVSDMSGTSFLDEGQEEFIVLAILVPMSFIYSYYRKGKSAKPRKGSKCLDYADSPHIEKLKRNSKGGINANVSAAERSAERDEYSALAEKIEACAKSGDVAGAGKLMSEAMESSLESNRLSICLGHLLQACNQAKDVKVATTSFQHMKAAGVKTNVVHYGTLISVHAQTGDIAGAEKSLQDCIESGIEPNTVCYNTMLYACSRAGNMSKLKEWLVRMDEAKIDRDHITFSTAIHGAIYAKDAHCLELWLKEMNSFGYPLQPRSYEDGLAMCAQGSFSHVAEALFQNLLKHKVSVTSKMVHHIARARLYGGNTESCIEVIESSLKDNLELSPATFVTGAEAASKLDDSGISALWLSRAEEKLPHSIDNFSLIASVALCAGKLDRASDWIQKLQESGSAEQITAGYVTLLKCCARLNDDASACIFADLAAKNGVPLTSEGYGAAIKACCRASNLQAAESFLNKLLPEDMVEDLTSFCIVIGLCARLEDAGRGEYWLNCMARVGQQSDLCLRTFLDMCEKSTSRAAKLSASRVIAKLDANRIHFSSGENSLNLLKVLLRLGQLKKSESVLQACASKFGKSIATQGHQALINAYAQEGNYAAAEHWLMRMTSSGLTADVIAFSTIIHACAKAKDPFRAEGVLVRMEEAGIEPNTICFNEVINAFAAAGDLKKAEYYFEAIKQRNLTPSTSTYNSILKACAKTGDVARAEVWYQKMVVSGIQGVELDATTFGTLMNATKDSDPIKTEKWLQIARSHGIELNVVHFSTAIHAYAKVGALEKAEALIEQALADGVKVNSMCYNNVISACAEAHQPDRAEEWLHTMRQSGVAPNSFTCFSIVNAWLKVNNFARAKSVITTMEAEGIELREEVFTAFAKAVARCGNAANLEDCISMAYQRGCQDNEFFLHAHLSALIRLRATDRRGISQEVVAVVRTANCRGVKLNPYIRAVLSKALSADRVAALIQECGGIEEKSKSSNKAPYNRHRS